MQREDDIPEASVTSKIHAKTHKNCFWLAEGCAVSQCKVWNSLLTNMDFNMEISS